MHNLQSNIHKGPSCPDVLQINLLHCLCEIMLLKLETLIKAYVLRRIRKKKTTKVQGPTTAKTISKDHQDIISKVKEYSNIYFLQ